MLCMFTMKSKTVRRATGRETSDGTGGYVGTLFCSVFLGLVRPWVCRSSAWRRGLDFKISSIRLSTWHNSRTNPTYIRSYSMLIHEKVLNLCSVWDLWRRKSFMIVCSYCNVDLRPFPPSSYQKNIRDFPRLPRNMFSFSLSCSLQKRRMMKSSLPLSAVTQWKEVCCLWLRDLFIFCYR
jgi:hypothetical protein